MELRGEERAAHERLFLAADAARAGRVEGRAAVAFFARAQLPVATLKRIWLRADAARRGFLGFSEFSVALRLVALAQRGEEVEMVEVEGADVPLPVFHGADFLLFLRFCWDFLMG